jgi:hypothetical protein
MAHSVGGRKRALTGQNTVIDGPNDLFECTSQWSPTANSPPLISSVGVTLGACA